jgi:hypothetical protein
LGKGWKTSNRGDGYTGSEVSVGGTSVWVASDEFDHLDDVGYVEEAEEEGGVIGRGDACHLYIISLHDPHQDHSRATIFYV